MIKFKKRCAVIISIAVLSMSSFSFAHSGRTDSSGGHRDNKNKSGLGSYHYHCGGYPAHLHKSGCPYTGAGKPVKPTTPTTPKPPVTPPAIVNKDDVTGHWAEKTIKEFSQKGYMGGYSDGRFKPDNAITRAEFVSVVNGYFGLTKTSGKVFEDTKAHWAKSAIDVAVTSGVCNGKTATEFRPNDPITREEAAVMISNYKKISDSELDKLSQFSDSSKVSNWSKEAVEGVIEKGYMGGYNDGTFKPNDKITRAEAAVTLSRISAQ